MELLDRLRRSVRDCVTCRSELEKDTALRTSRLRAQHEQALTAEQARWAAETKKTNSTAAASQTAVEAIFATRKTRIAKALNNAQQERLKRIEAEEGKHTFENQSGLFEAERVRDTETLQNKTQHESFTTELTNERAALDRLPGSALAIVTSANVVALLRPWLAARGSWPDGVGCLAIGGASARAVRELGVPVAHDTPGALRSEELLATPELAAGCVRGRRVVILRGEGGRELLGAELGRRGAEVVIAELYRRAPPPDVDPQRLAGWLRDGAIDIVTASSNESLTNLFDLLDARGRESLLSTPLLVVSPRGAQLARTLGWRPAPVLAAGADDAAIVAALAAWRASRTATPDTLRSRCVIPSAIPPEDPT